MLFELKINGTAHRIDVDEDTPLLYVLNGELGLKGPRFGCGLAQCGSCSVLVDGVEVRSCVAPASALAGTDITTLEGLPRFHALKKGLKQIPELHPMQQAVIDEQALQCGYCYNGMVVKGAELLASNPRPTEAQIRDAMAGHICRCGTYSRITKAVLRAAVLMVQEGGGA